MNRREKLLAIIVGAVVGIGFVYQVVNFLLISPKAEAVKDIEDLTAENQKLDAILRSGLNLAERWRDYAGKSLSYDRPQTSNIFGRDLKEIARRNGFPDAVFTPTSGTKIGRRTDIVTVAYRVSAEGPFQKALDLLGDVYRTPYHSQITKLSIRPILQRNTPNNEVKIEFTVETPLLPRIDRRENEYAAGVTTMPAEKTDLGHPARIDLPPPSALALLSTRNIFKPYVPPPENVVMLQNKDWKTAAVRLFFSWEGEINDRKVETVPGDGQASVKGFGDVVEIRGRYADGASFGPERIEFGEKKDWSYVIKAHHPPPPVETVAVAVKNEHKDPVFVDMVVTTTDGKTKSYPTMRFEPGKVVSVDEFEAKAVTMVGSYQSGKKAPSQSFTPRKGQQVYTMPPEPAEPVVATNPRDLPPDAQYTVTGLVTYEGRQEMIASGTAPGTRIVIPMGDEGTIDGGTLLAVHPLGAVVKMPSGNYYIYPLGKPFTERAQLDAKEDTELPAAIDAWANPEPAEEKKETIATTVGARAAQSPRNVPQGRDRTRRRRPNRR